MKSREEELYEEEKGRPPSRIPDDHPYFWQWEYDGKNREVLLERLGLEEEPAVIEGQEELPL